MKRTKLYVTGMLAGASLALTCVSSHAYVGPTNFFAYNFDTSAQNVFGNWFGGDYYTNGYEPSGNGYISDSSNNPTSGSEFLELHYNHNQYVLWDSATPTYSPLPIAGVARFTNLEFDVLYYDYGPGLYRTNATGQPTDFGLARIGSRETGYAQDWYYYYSVPATNSLGPNTNWVHIQVDLNGVATAYPSLGSSGLINTMFGADDGAYNPALGPGTQFIFFDNIFFTGWVAPVPPPTLAIQGATPGLNLWGGTGQYGRSELQISTNYLNGGWIGAGTTYPVSYSFTMVSNAAVEEPGGLDAHLTFLPSPPDTPEGNSGADYQQANCLWLQILSGGGTNVSAVCNFSWKTNDGGCNPNNPHTNALGVYNGGVVVFWTNSVRAGTWTLTWSNDHSGSITCPGTNSLGVNPIPFDLTVANTQVLPGGYIPAHAIDAAGIDTNFANPMYVRFGDMNYGNTAHASYFDIWKSISVSGTAGTNFSVDFTKLGSATPDTNLWDLTSSDGGAAVTVVVPTNVAYWVRWNTPDTGWDNFETATNITGPWRLVSYYNGYGDATNAAGEYIPSTQAQHGANRWNLMLPQYLPTANGLTNPPGGNPLSPIAFFGLTTDTNRPPQ